MPVPPNPTVKLTFNGLLVFAFNEAQQICEVGVLKAAPHVFRITHTTTDAEKTCTYNEIATEIETGDVYIEIPGKSPSVSTFSDQGNSADPESVRWLPDIEGPEFHHRKLPLKPGFPPQRIVLRQGLFYTATQIPADLVLPTTKKVKPIQIAHPLGCNFYLQEGEKFVMSYGVAGQKLELIATAGITHELTILNTPRKHKDKPHDAFTHFPLFYEHAVEVPAGERFNIEKFKHQGSAGDIDIPCPGIRLGYHPKGLTTD